MKFVVSAVLAAATVLALAACQTTSSGKRADAGASIAPAIATPPGVGLKTTRGIRNAAGNILPGPLAYTNSAGRFLYIHEKGACDTACDGYAPVLASKGFKINGDWGTLGPSQQLTFKGNPLYVSTAEQEGTTYKMCTFPRRGNGEAVDEFPSSWCVGLYQPSSHLKTPDGFAIHELPNANGQGLVDSDGFTLYAFAGRDPRVPETCAEASCKPMWKPVEAAALAGPVGDFSIVKRFDGTSQWAFMGHPLYTFTGDLLPGDTNGIGVERQSAAVIVSSYFMPPGVAIKVAPGFGTIFTDSAGMTLYTQNRGARGRGPSRPVPQVDCDTECQKLWHPFKAPDDAEPSGLWTIVTAPDGGKQWAYRGQGLFSYSLDRKPGDMKGEYIYSYYKTDPNGKITNIANGRSAVDVPVSWRPAFPY